MAPFPVARTIGDSFSTILAPPLRNRKFVDSLLERAGFENSVPRSVNHAQSAALSQQPLAADRSGVQLLFRRDRNLAVIDCGWCLAAERDPVIADDIDAHWWVLLVCPRGGCRQRPTLTLSSPTKATLFRII